ncbi:MAG: DUF4349 domain-containing protein [Leptospiraceae bacterium]|nr:DUF4349 domain-containing protein [Leptospiraceae bacterium]
MIRATTLLLILSLAAGMHCSIGSAMRDVTTGSYEEGATESYPEQAKRSRRDLEEAEDAPASATDESPRERMVIYKAGLQSTVNEIEPALQKARAISEKYGGYVEKQKVDKDDTTAYLVLRVPVKSFQDVLADLSAIGKVVKRDISADDITREFADLSQRLENRKRLLARLYDILKKTTDTRQKIRILNEIARLNKEVESMQARKDYMEKKAAFSTIEVSFRAEARTSVNQGSAIPWIRSLRPDRRTLSHAPDFTFEMPSGFLDYSDDYGDDGDYIYASPDGVQIRAATIENNPEADAAYYERALLYERGRYPEKVLSSESSANRVSLTTPQQVGYNKAFYTIVLFVDGQDLHVIEVFYPTEEIFKKQRSAVERVIKSIEPKSILDILEGIL